MRDKYLYFGVVAGKTETFNNVDDATPTLQLTHGFINPIPVGEDYLTNGGAKVTAPAIAAHVFGTGYRTPAVGEVTDITKGCTIHATSALITISTTAQDSVWGMDLSSTDADNDTFVVTQLKPYEALDAFVYNSRYLRGIAGTTATTTQLHFQGKTGDIGATHDVDTFTVTHGSAKFKEFAGQLTDVLADDNKVNGMVVVVDDMRGLVLPHDAAEIASVTQSATAS